MQCLYARTRTTLGKIAEYGNTRREPFAANALTINGAGFPTGLVPGLSGNAMRSFTGHAGWKEAA